MQGHFFQWVPSHPAKQIHVLHLHVREELVTPLRIRTADSQPDQLRTKLSDLAIVSTDGKSGAPPDAQLRLMNADGAHNCIQFMGTS